MIVYLCSYKLKLNLSFYFNSKSDKNWKLMSKIVSIIQFSCVYISVNLKKNKNSKIFKRQTEKKQKQFKFILPFLFLNSTLRIINGYKIFLSPTVSLYFTHRIHSETLLLHNTLQNFTHFS